MRIHILYPVYLSVFLSFFLALQDIYSQEVHSRAGESLNAIKPADSRRGDAGIRVMFYNVENLFDVVNDSLTMDDEYTPQGSRRWTFSRLQRKVNNIAKVIIRAGGWEPPEIIGLCEVENRYVLTNLTTDSPLKNIGYRIIHRDSPDPRGIDVAMLYRPEKFTPVETKYIGIRFPFEPEARTRDILYVKGVVLKKDTLHLFVNHWPSRFGGHQATIPKREFVAQQLRRLVDSLMVADQGARILIMGDLNDEPTDPSVSKVLNATQDSLNLAPGQLYNMMTGAGSDWNYGTIKDKELWITIDQFIVSSSLLKRNEGLHTVPHWIRIMNPPFLLQKDDAWFGQKPFRTYYGFEYIGGFSDHLPIYMDLKY